MKFLRHIMYIRALRQAVASTSMYMSNSSRLASSSYVTKYWSWGASNDYLSRFYALCSDFFGGPSSGMPAIAAAGAPVFEAAEHESAASPLDWDGLFRAAPKKKVSHSRKAMRAANKGLKDRVGMYLVKPWLLIADIVHCEACSRPKLQHHLCEHCYGDFARNLKRMNKASGA